MLNFGDTGYQDVIAFIYFLIPTSYRLELLPCIRDLTVSIPYCIFNS